MDCLGFYKSWLRSMRDDQFDDGRIPDVISRCDARHRQSRLDGRGNDYSMGSLCPQRRYKRVVENYSMMERLVGWYRSQSVGGLLPTVKGYGDWLQPYAGKTQGDTPYALIGAAHYGAQRPDPR